MYLDDEGGRFLGLGRQERSRVRFGLKLGCWGQFGAGMESVNEFVLNLLRMSN